MRRRLVIASVGLALVIAACGGFEQRSLCRDYENLLASAAQIDDLDPETATADDVRQIAADVSADLAVLTASAEEQYNQAISDLQLALDELEQTAYDLGGTNLVEAQPLLEDSFDNTVVKFRILAERLDVVCGTA
jgi:hypothetical protein